MQLPPESIPHPDGRGWQWGQDLNVLQTVWFSGKRLPDALAALRTCNCKAGNCANNLCGCKSNSKGPSQYCTALCGCSSECQNKDPQAPVPTIDDELDEFAQENADIEDVDIDDDDEVVE